MMDDFAAAFRWLTSRAEKWYVRLGGLIALLVLGGLVITGLTGYGLRDIWERDLGKESSNLPRGEDAGNQKSCTSPANTLGKVGYGPERTSFTLDKPATYAVLNSITDSSAYGDERSFFDVRAERNNSSGSYCTNLAVEDGEFLILRVYVANSAADNLEEEAGATARNVRLRLSQSAPASAVTIFATLRGENTRPQEIYDVVQLTSSGPFRLDVVRDGVKAVSLAEPNGRTLVENIESANGMLLGHIRPPYLYRQIVTIRARVTHVS